MAQRRIDGSAWIAWRLLFGRGPWCQGSPLCGGEAALDAMVRVQNLVAHAIQALLQASGAKTSMLRKGAVAVQQPWRSSGLVETVEGSRILHQDATPGRLVR